jgi:hypothetical protein
MAKKKKPEHANMRPPTGNFSAGWLSANANSPRVEAAAKAKRLRLTVTSVLVVSTLNRSSAISSGKVSARDLNGHMIVTPWTLVSRGLRARRHAARARQGSGIAACRYLDRVSPTYQREEDITLPPGDVPWALMEHLERVLHQKLEPVRDPETGIERAFSFLAWVFFEGGSANEATLAETRAALRDRDLATLKSVSVDARVRGDSHQVSCWYRKTMASGLPVIRIAVEGPDDVFCVGWLGTLKAEVEYAIANPSVALSPVAAPLAPSEVKPLFLEQPWVKYVALPLLIGLVLVILGVILTVILT